MYSDNTLTPKEATRLCALGTLATKPMTYAELASAVRHFISHMIGPSLDVLGTSIELLKYEGLVESSGDGDEAELLITDAGHEELQTLLTANIRGAATEFNNLIIALKFRFLHLLKTDDQMIQADLLMDASEIEQTRLLDLRQHHSDEPGHLTRWLDHEIKQVEDRISWLEQLSTGLAS